MRTVALLCLTFVLTIITIASYRTVIAVRMSIATSLPMTFVGVITTPRYLAAALLVTAAAYLLSR